MVRPDDAAKSKRQGSGAGLAATPVTPLSLPTEPGMARESFQPELMVKPVNSVCLLGRLAK